VTVRRPEFIARQAACPSGPLGQWLGRIMAMETAGANKTAVDVLRFAVASALGDSTPP
jgi:hypothetical protein